MFPFLVTSIRYIVPTQPTIGYTQVLEMLLMEILNFIFLFSLKVHVMELPEQKENWLLTVPSPHVLDHNKAQDLCIINTHTGCLELFYKRKS